MKRFLAPLLIALLLLSAPRASAQPMGGELEQYEDYLQRGSRAFDAKDFETALLLFAKAQEIHDHPRLRFSMGRIYEELDQCIAAKMMFVILIENAATPAELRQEAGARLANIESCGPQEESPPAQTVSERTAPEPKPAASDALVPGAFSEPVQWEALRRTTRRLGFWSLGVGGGLTVAGIVFATSVFVPEKHRDCYGLGVSIDAQIAACQRLADREGMQFIEAHVASRRIVHSHRLASATLVAAGLVGAGLGIGLLYFDRAEHVAVRLGVDNIAVAVRF